MTIPIYVRAGSKVFYRLQWIMAHFVLGKSGPELEVVLSNGTKRFYTNSKIRDLVPAGEKSCPCDAHPTVLYSDLRCGLCSCYFSDRMHILFVDYASGSGKLTNSLSIFISFMSAAVRKLVDSHGTATAKSDIAAGDVQGGIGQQGSRFLNAYDVDVLLREVISIICCPRTPWIESSS